LIEPVETSAPALWDRLRSRKVVQWGLGYIAVAWGLLQGTEFAVSTFHWPEVFTRVGAIAAVAGLPITLTIAWFHGNRGEQRVRRLELGLLAFLVVAGGFAIYREAQQATVSGVTAPASTPDAAPAAAIPARSVAVLPFESIGEAKDGAVLAFGIAEAVLHQLANLRELEVTARTSSFSLQQKSGDARVVGRTLNVRYLLEGSVQEAGDRLRVTAQLIDTTTGAHVWSIRFDKARADIFAMQDEIAAQVAEALKLSLDADATDRLAGQGTTHVNAYLAYLQGRSLLATGNVSEAGRAIEQFTRALQLDPSFAAAYVSLAEADLYLAEFDETDDRAARFAAAGLRAAAHVTKALTLDAKFGPAYIMRGYLEAFSDLAAAEADYRRGLELRPSDAKGYAGLAAVLFEQRGKRAEALQMLEHARRLDPLEPAHDVSKAVFLDYDRGDVEGAKALLRSVLQRNPTYTPAAIRLGVLARFDSETSEAIKYLELAIKLDPLANWARRVLMRAYLDIDDERAAESVLAETTRLTAIMQLPLAIYRKEWRRAGELSYAAYDNQLVTGVDEALVVLAMRRHARLTGEYQAAIDVMEEWSGLTWSPGGIPNLPQRQDLKLSAQGVADMLLQTGQTARAQRLLKTIISQFADDLQSGLRSEIWATGGMSRSFALLHDDRNALEWLERGQKETTRELLDSDPAYDHLHRDPRYLAVIEAMNKNSTHERQEVEQMRASGELPRR
jgi:TolB-like protein